MGHRFSFSGSKALPTSASSSRTQNSTSSCPIVLMALLFQCCVIMAFMLSIMFKTSNAGSDRLK